MISDNRRDNCQKTNQNCVSNNFLKQMIPGDSSHAPGILYNTNIMARTITIRGKSYSTRDLATYRINQEKFQIMYQIRKQWQAYIDKEERYLEKLFKEFWVEETIKVMKFTRSHEFRKDQILSIQKFWRKNKDGIPYFIVIMDIMNKKKNTVLDLDSPWPK